MVKIGEAVTYVDPTGKERAALVTEVHGTVLPCCINIVVVTDNDKQIDDYGRKTERHSSVSHASSTGIAHGNYWK